MKTAPNKEVRVNDVGITDYKSCWDFQEKLFNGIVEMKMRNRDAELPHQTPTPNYLLLTEHPHVYTLGKSGDEKNLLVSEAQLSARNATFYKINRGGDITYHGPGQLVAYPILDLDNFFTDIHRYLRVLEEAVIETIAAFGIKGGRRKGETGVWIDAADDRRARKICAMGVRCSRWVTMHGLALNVNTDLSYFNHIIPCGISDKQVTSISAETGSAADFENVKSIFTKAFAAGFGAQLVPSKSIPA